MTDAPIPTALPPLARVPTPPLAVPPAPIAPPPPPPAAPEFAPKVFIPFGKKAGFFTRRRIWLFAIAAAIIVAAGFAYGWYRASSRSAGEYETVAAKRGSLKQTVTVTGAVKSASEFSLNFEASGRIARVTVGKGDAVKAGQVLATLEGTDYTLAATKAHAVLAQAEADLAKAVAGATPEDIRVKEAALEEAVATLSQATTTLANTRSETAIDIKTAELGVTKAQAEADAANQTLADDRQSKGQAIVSALSTELSDTSAAAVTMATAGTDMDDILGVDNTLVNDAFEYLLAVTNPPLLGQAKDAYKPARDAKRALDAKLASFSADPSAEDADAAAKQAKQALAIFSTALAKTRAVLDATPGGDVLTLADLSDKKTTMDTDRTAVNAKNNTLSGDLNAVILARINRDATEHADQAAVTAAAIALAQAKHDLEVAKLQAATKIAADTADVAVYSAKRDEAQAALDQITAKLREVDRAPLEAAAAGAKAAADSADADLTKTEIRAPTDGIVTDAPINIGELASSATKAISMLSTHYEVEADVSETDIAKIKIGQAADITFDALGPDSHFAGSILSVNPAETVIQDIVYYKVRVVIGQDSDQIKPGMTANLTVLTATKDNALLIPLRAVQEEANQRFVQVLRNGKTERHNVTLGLRGDEGLVEIVAGLEAGDQVVTGLKTP
jgi:HlyD family secretion protein